jgi:uncharacterized lipoprotein
MKKLILLEMLVLLLSGCSWLHHGEQDGSAYSGGSIAGPDYGVGRGTTGVSSGADGGHGITGSDAAPPR